MFFIDDDQPKVAEGQEQRRARADDKLHAALAAHLPQPPPLALGGARMPLAGACAKARLDPRQEFTRQRDLRQEDQRLTPLTQTFRDRLEIDLGLARSGHTLQQIGPVPPGARAQGLGARFLIV